MRSGLPTFSLLQQLCHHSSPTSLVAGTYAPACITMEVLVEQQVVAEVGVGLKCLVFAEDRAASMPVTQEDVREPTRELIGDLPERELLARARGTLHQKIVSIVVVKL